MITSNVQNISNLHIFITCWDEDVLKQKNVAINKLFAVL